MSSMIAAISGVILLFIAIAVGLLMGIADDAGRRHRVHSVAYRQARKFPSSDYELGDTEPVRVNSDI